MDGLTTETCEECGFDAGAWRVRDAVTILDAAGFWWQLATDGVAAADLAARPAPGVWSALEYGVHTASVTAVLRAGIERVLASDGVQLPAPPVVADAAPDDVPAVLDPTEILDAVAREGRALAALARSADEAAWAHRGSAAGVPVEAHALLVHAVHDVTHHQMDVGRGLAALGVGTPTHEGRVAQVSASGGGVPKLAIDRASIGHRGVEGDRQHDTKHHGRPFQALCLWSSEVIAGLVAEGHPIGAGSAGENLTLEGVDWASLRPGARLRIGTALAEISLPAVPCAKQARWFSDGDFSRLAHEVRPAGVRWYAWVREPGEVAQGDAVVVQPSP